jgi:two-component system nitrate/nitrite response regulator NarL
VNETIKIAIAEDFELERNGLIALFGGFEGLQVVLSVANGKELLEGLKSVKPDIVLLDIEMKVMGGTEAFEKIRERYPALKVIMLTEHYTDSYIAGFMLRGASAFLSKNSRIEKVVETIRKVHDNISCHDFITANALARATATDLPKKPARDRPDLNLTVREIEIIRLVCMGRENREIHKMLDIDVRTIETHRRNIRAKTSCKNVVELADFAFKNNLISI